MSCRLKRKARKRGEKLHLQDSSVQTPPDKRRAINMTFEHSRHNLSDQIQNVRKYEESAFDRYSPQQPGMESGDPVFQRSTSKQPSHYVEKVATEGVSPKYNGGANSKQFSALISGPQIRSFASFGVASGIATRPKVKLYCTLLYFTLLYFTFLYYTFLDSTLLYFTFLSFPFLYSHLSSKALYLPYSSAVHLISDVSQILHLCLCLSCFE